MKSIDPNSKVCVISVETLKIRVTTMIISVGDASKLDTSKNGAHR